MSLLVGLCKECFADVGLHCGNKIPGYDLYECPECDYPNDWYDFNGVYEISPLCACGHDVSDHGADRCLACQGCKGMSWDNRQ